MMRKNSSLMAAGLCILMLAACLAALIRYLQPGLMENQTAPVRDDMLGMVLIDIPDQAAAASYHVTHFGVYVLAVDEDSQAYRLGVRSGDRLSSVNGANVATTSEFARLQESASADTPLEVTFYRGPEEEKVLATFMHETVSE